MTAAQHAPNCEWHFEQYPHECTCGVYTPTGRYNPDRGPNMQNIPIRTPEGKAIRDSFVENIPPKTHPSCNHDWHELVDDDNQLIEPVQDICVNCGEKR